MTFGLFRYLASLLKRGSKSLDQIEDDAPKTTALARLKARLSRLTATAFGGTRGFGSPGGMFNNSENK